MGILRFLIDQDIIDRHILRRKIKLRVPDFLPRAIAPGDVRKILGAIKKTRDRALVLVLLRTGTRIGEVLGLKMRDLDVRERKIHIYEGEKNSLGRVVYLSDDALMVRNLGTTPIFYEFDLINNRLRRPGSLKQIVAALNIAVCFFHSALHRPS